MQLRKYDFTLTYKRGKDLVIADTLSRAFINDKFFDEAIDIEMEAQVCLTAIKNYYKQQTELDADLVKLKRVIINGWPNKIKDLSADIKFYFKYRHELIQISIRSYKIALENGSTIVRNRKFIKKFNYCKTESSSSELKQPPDEVFPNTNCRQYIEVQYENSPPYVNTTGDDLNYLQSGEEDIMTRRSTRIKCKPTKLKDYEL
ncbi:hypothetical protein PPYR_00567 [Photinus pyralis]|uniref:Uncharacterized protein n=1 Tax=Photinus pyralis TaxID=7054 RepID=A0A5N4B1X4_PHOPY|nr:hypothetical protein PPYR_00567 [Photinus pyralis]